MTDLNKPGGGCPNDPKLGMDELVTDREKELKGTLKEYKPEGFKKRIDYYRETKEDLKKNHVKIEENTEIMGYKGKKVHIDLPAVGGFEGFKFDYFTSYEPVDKKDLENNPELETKSYSISDITQLLQATNRYMIELGLENDGENFDYESKLKLWNWKYISNIWSFLQEIARLDMWYWLKDKNGILAEDFTIDYDLYEEYPSNHDDNKANLFLKLSE